MINSAYGSNFPLDFLTALFGVSVTPFPSKHFHRVFAFVTLLARRLILLEWKSSLPPSTVSLRRDLLLNIKLEKLRFTRMGSLEVFETVWRPLLDYLDTNAMD